MTRCLTGLTAAFISVFLPFLAAGAEKPLTNEQIIINFNTVAFGNEYTRSQYQYIRKWKDPIRAAILGKPPDEFDDMVVAFIDELIAATGHRIALYYSPRMKREGRLPKWQKGKQPKANFFMIYDTINGIEAFTTKNKIPEGKHIVSTLKAGKAHCMATIYRKNKNIVRSIVYFPSHLSLQAIRICIVEELTQVMGLPNDSLTITQSIFRDRGKHNELQPQDRLFLRLLYDPRVEYGMERVAALNVVYAILNHIRPAGIKRPGTS